MRSHNKYLKKIMAPVDNIVKNIVLNIRYNIISLKMIKSVEHTLNYWLSNSIEKCLIDNCSIKSRNNLNIFRLILNLEGP